MQNNCNLGKLYITRVCNSIWHCKLWFNL